MLIKKVSAPKFKKSLEVKEKVAETFKEGNRINWNQSLFTVDDKKVTFLGTRISSSGMDHICLVHSSKDNEYVVCVSENGCQMFNSPNPYIKNLKEIDILKPVRLFEDYECEKEILFVTKLKHAVKEYNLVFSVNEEYVMLFDAYGFSEKGNRIVNFDPK